MSFSVTKEKWDIIYLLDSEVGLESGYDSERPYIIIEVMEDNDVWMVVPLTTKKSYDDQDQVRLSIGSNINIPLEIHSMTGRYIQYAQLADFEINDEDAWKIENAINNG